MQRQINGNNNRPANYDWKVSDTFKVLHILATLAIFASGSIEDWHMFLVCTTVPAILSLSKQSYCLLAGKGSLDMLNAITKIVLLMSTMILLVFYLQR